MWHWVARGNIQQISYILQTEQHRAHAVLLQECNVFLRMGACVWSMRPDSVEELER